MQDAQRKAKEDQKLSVKLADAKEKQAKEKEGKENNKGNKKNSKEKEDPDPDGEKLVSIPDPLKEASKLLQVLRENHSDDLQTQILSFEVRFDSLSQYHQFSLLKLNLSLVTITLKIL